MNRQEDKRCLVQDNDCHWYCIPVDRKEEFYKWVETGVKFWETYDESLGYDDSLFAGYGIDSPEDIVFFRV